MMVLDGDLVDSDTRVGRFGPGWGAPGTPKRIDKKAAKLSLSQEFLNCLGRILESIAYFLRIS